MRKTAYDAPHILISMSPFMTETEKIEAVTYLCSAAALVAVLKLGLLPALLSGLLVFELVEMGAPTLVRKTGVTPLTGKILLFLFVTLIIVGSVGFGIVIVTTQIMGKQGNVAILLQSMADIVDSARNHMPSWIQEYLPSTLAEWQNASSEWLRENASRVGSLGKGIGIFFADVIIGMIVGGLVAFARHNGGTSKTKFVDAATDRATLLSEGFRQIVFSQVRISALNTFLTAIFLTLILPAMGTPLPLTKTMITITFIVGLLPIIGNLISNTMIVLVSLGVSLTAAVGALIFLILLHKLEYFINARIIGTRIRARAWELLVAMLVMESAFGLSGLVAAPIYYAYLKQELLAKKMI